MKYFSFIFLFLFISCGTEKNKEVNNTEQVIEMNGFIEGVVHVTSGESDCGIYIESDSADQSKGFYPVNLDVKYKKNGLKVRFRYSPSRAPLPENCEEYMAVVIDEMTAI